MAESFGSFELTLSPQDTITALAAIKAACDRATAEEAPVLLREIAELAQEGLNRVTIKG